jgi:hypothetical protein
VHAKDVQIYFNAEGAERVLEQHHLGATIEAPAGGDSLFVVDANIAAVKANGFMTYQLADAVTLDARGTALHRTTLRYTWPANPASLTLSYPAGAPGYYHGYLRVYAPPKAELQQGDGWVQHPTTAEFARAVWGGDIYVHYGQTTTLTLTWKLPAAATRDTAGWHYGYLAQKQAGITYPLDLAVTLPPCASVVGAPDGWTRSGHTLGAKVPLTTDAPLAVAYTIPAGPCPA